MKAFAAFASLALGLGLSVAGCAEDVETHPRQPQEVREAIVAEPVQAAPVPASPALPAGVVVVPARPDGEVGVAPGPRPRREVDVADLETWPSRNPVAAKALGTWVHNNPEAAAMIFKWDRKRPGRSRELVRWAIRHPKDDIAAFTAKHPDWSWFDMLMQTHHVGGDQYIAWCRQYPSAAEELVRYDSGLRWVGDHLYASEWQAE